MALSPDGERKIPQQHHAGVTWRCERASAAGALFEQARCLAQRDFEILVGSLGESVAGGR
jgi:hypothetical protein